MKKVENSTEMVVTPTAVEDPNPLPIQYRTISVPVLASHVYSFGSGKNKVTALDAAGVRFIAGCIGLSIEEVEITEMASDLLGKAKAVTKDGRSYFGVSSQSKKLPNGQPDKFAWQKCVTKCQRNAFLGLIPAPLLNEAIAAVAKW